MKPFRHRLGAVLLALAAGSGLRAASTNVGSQAAPWLLLPQSARIAAMGGAFVAIADDVNTLAVNPAGLAGQAGQRVSLMHDATVQDTSLEHVAYGVGLGASDGLAVGLNYMNYGSVATSTVSNGQLVSTGSQINPYGDSLDLGYGHAFGSVSVGATLETVTENLANAATNAAVGADLGVLWRQAPDRGLSAGVAAQNLGTTLDGAALPANWQAGLGYRLPVLEGRQNLDLAADAALPEADAAADSISLGAEYSGGGLWTVRAGYKFVGDGGIGGLSVGGGLTYGIAGLDYAFVNEGVLGDANQISLSARF